MAIISLLLAAILVTVDQVTKYFVTLHLKPVGKVPVIENFFNLTYLENRGAALGSMQNLHWLLIPATIIGCLFLVVLLFRYKEHTMLSYMAMALIIAGGVGNLIDRIRFRFVVDFLDFPWFGYVFNAADCWVTVGAVLLMVAIIRHDGKQKKREAPKTKDMENEA